MQPAAVQRWRNQPATQSVAMQQSIWNRGKAVQAALDNDRPIFLQVKEAIEGDILAGQIKPDEQIPSNSQLVSFFGINPVTVHKGVTLLAEEGTVYKKRGLGMFVSANAPTALRKKYAQAFAQAYIDPLVQQAHLLGMDQREVQALLDQAFNNGNVLRRIF